MHIIRALDLGLLVELGCQLGAEAVDINTSLAEQQTDTATFLVQKCSH